MEPAPPAAGPTTQEAQEQDFDARGLRLYDNLMYYHSRRPLVPGSPVWGLLETALRHTPTAPELAPPGAPAHPAVNMRHSLGHSMILRGMQLMSDHASGRDWDFVAFLTHPTIFPAVWLLATTELPQGADPWHPPSFTPWLADAVARGILPMWDTFPVTPQAQPPQEGEGSSC